MRNEWGSISIRFPTCDEVFSPILYLAGVVGIALSLRRASDSSTISPSRLGRKYPGQCVANRRTKLTGRNLDYVRNFICLYCEYLPLTHGERHLQGNAETKPGIW